MSPSCLLMKIGWKNTDSIFRESELCLLPFFNLAHFQRKSENGSGLGMGPRTPLTNPVKPCKNFNQTRSCLAFNIKRKPLEKSKSPIRLSPTLCESLITNG